jgi:hypothetical protein
MTNKAYEADMAGVCHNDLVSITVPFKLQTLRVATSTNKIANALALYFYAASLYYGYWFVREGLMWHVSRLDSIISYQGDALQYAKQLFYISLPQMTKYCIMRECENIIRGYLYVCDLAFVILKGIYGFKFPKVFWRSLPEISLLHLLFSSS